MKKKDTEIQTFHCELKITFNALTFDRAVTYCLSL